jgi:hypothetical protein
MALPKMKPSKDRKDLGAAMSGSPNPQRKEQQEILKRMSTK